MIDASSTTHDGLPHRIGAFVEILLAGGPLAPLIPNDLRRLHGRSAKDAYLLDREMLRLFALAPPT